ncbi:MAG: MFS transporter [Thalassobaculales bacterium]
MIQVYLAVGAVMLSVALMQVASGIFSTFLPIRLAADNYPPNAIGLMATGHALGFFVACLVAATIIRRVGHIRAFAFFAALNGVGALSFYALVDPWWWAGVRTVIGFCTAGMFVVAESWLTDKTPRSMRGSVIAVYMVGQKLSFAGGQLALALGDLLGATFFMLASAFYVLAIMPLSLTAAASPALPQVNRLGVRELYAIAPAALVSSFLIGLMNAAVTHVGPLYGAAVGYSVAEVGAMMAAMQVGSLLIQWPMGWTSDRIDRRLVIIAAAGACAVLSLLIALLAGVPGGWMLVLFGLWGAFALSIYGICVAHANDFAPQGQTVSVSSGLLLCWAVGSIVGPLLATQTMAWIGPPGLFLQAGVAAAAMAGFVGWRMTRRKPVPVEERAPWSTVPTTSPAAAALDPRQNEQT